MKRYKFQVVLYGDVIFQSDDELVAVAYSVLVPDSRVEFERSRGGTERKT